MDAISSLPDLLRENIFFHLNGGSLHTCRLVSPSWNQYVQDLWRSKRGRKQFERILESNWRFPINNDTGEPKYQISVRERNIPFNGYIQATSNNNIAFRTWSSHGFFGSRLAVYNFPLDEWWEIDIVGSVQNCPYALHDFRVVLTDTYVAVRFMLVGHPSRNILKIWSIESRSMIYEERIHNLNYMYCNPFENSDLLIIYSDFVQILNFQGIPNVKISKVLSPSNDYAYGTFNYPYVLQNLYNSDENTRMLKVWKYDKKTQDLTLHFSVPNLNGLIKYEENRGFLLSIEDIIYSNNFFIATVNLCLKLNDGLDENDEEEAPEPTYIFCLAILIVNHEGEIMKHVPLLNIETDINIDYHLYKGKLLFQADENVYISETTWDKLCMEMLVGKDSTMRFNRIDDLNGRHELLLTKFEARSATIEEEAGVLNIQTLNFWNKN